MINHEGRLTIAEFLEAISTPGTHFSGSDWKYGWPHKFYIDVPNPEPDRLSEVGGESGPHVDGSDPADIWICRAHGRTQCTCPKERATGYWSRIRFGPKPLLHCKFYNDLLRDASDEDLARVSAVTKKFLRIAFGRDERGFFWVAVPNTQVWGVVGADLEPDYSEMGDWPSR